MSITDAALARRFLERAIAHQTNPALDTATVDDLMTIAASLDTDGVTTLYTGADLNRAASMGWQFKAGLTSDQYDLGGGPGKTLTRSQWFDHCMSMSASYASGAMNVLGGTGTTRRGIGSISLVSPLSTESEAV